MSCAVVFDIAAFRVAYPAYADPVAFSDAQIERAFDEACCFIAPGPHGACTRLAGACLELAQGLMTAHMLGLELAVASGGASGGAFGLVSAASVDKVSVTLTPPPVRSQYGWWLSLTPYGGKLLALLRSKAAGGLYVGGTPTERGAFRKTGGGFASAKRTS